MAKFWLVDTETTGLDPDKNQIIEVGMMAIDDNFDVSEHDTFLVKHNEYSINAKALKVNGISLDEVEQYGLTEADATDRIISFVQKNKPENSRLIFMGQNCQFDESFIKRLIAKTGKSKEYSEAVDYHKLDLMSVAMYESISGKIQTQKFNLDSIAESLRIPVSDAASQRHRAIYDCLLELNCFRKLMGKSLLGEEMLRKNSYLFSVGNEKVSAFEEKLITNRIQYKKFLCETGAIFKVNRADKSKVQSLLENIQLKAFAMRR